MINGLDTTFLVEMEVMGHPHHDWARRIFSDAIERREKFALAPQVLAEFAHVITDARRFTKPLSMNEAVQRADAWWRAAEVIQVFPTEESTSIFIEWMETFRLGRKRLLDTMLASTYRARNIRSIFSTNARDYGVFGCFDVHSPA